SAHVQSSFAASDSEVPGALERHPIAMGQGPRIHRGRGAGALVVGLLDAFLIAAHLFFWVAAMRFRPAALIVRFGFLVAGLAGCGAETGLIFAHLASAPGPSFVWLRHCASVEPFGSQTGRLARCCRRAFGGSQQFLASMRFF